MSIGINEGFNLFENYQDRDYARSAAAPAGSITVSISEVQASQSEAIVVAETYTTALTETQPLQTESIAASESYILAVSETQAVQTEAINGTVAVAIDAAIVETQALQTESITGTVPAPVPVPPPFIGGGYGGLMPRFWIDKLTPPLRKKKQRIPVPAAVEPPDLTPARVASMLARLPFIDLQRVTAAPSLDEAIARLRKIAESVKNRPVPPTVSTSSPEAAQQARIKQEDQEILDLILTEVA